MQLDHQLYAGQSTNCASVSPSVIDPNFAQLATWLNGETITNQTTVLPRDLTLANTYSAHAARWNNPTGGILTQSSENPFPCAQATQYSIETTGLNNSTKLYSNSHTGLQLGSGNFTIEVWIKMKPTISGYAGQRIIEKGSNQGNEYYEFMLWGLDGKQTSSSYLGISGFCFFACSSASTAPFIGGSETVASNYWGKPKINKWSFLSITRNGNNWYMHQDGVLQQQFSKTQSIYSSTRGLTIGYRAANVTGSTDPANKQVCTKMNVVDLKIYKGIAKYTNQFYTPPLVSNLS